MSRKKNKTVTVRICTPVDDGARFEFWSSVLNLIIAAPSVFTEEVAFETSIDAGDSLITRARNNLANDFLNKSKADYLLFLDSDLEFTVEDIRRLLEMRKPDAVVCGQYAIKQAELRFCYNTIKGEAVGADGLLKVGEAGTGCMLIPRKILEALRDKGSAPEYTDDLRKDTRYSFFDVGVVGGRYLSEDWLFCRRVRQLGFPVYMDTQILMPHLGWAKYPLSDDDVIKAIASRAVNPQLLKSYKRDIDKAAKARWKANCKRSSQAQSKPCKAS